jgi:hypothetical protein
MLSTTVEIPVRVAAQQSVDLSIEHKLGAADQRKWTFLLIAITTAYLYASLFSFSGTPYFRAGDETFFWTYACRLLSGQTFLKDFHQFTPPGTDLLYAAAFRAFGVGVRTTNWIILWLGVAVALVVYSCAQSILPKYWAALASFVSVVLVYGDRMDATHHWFSSLANLLAVLCILPRRTPKRIAAAGVLLALAAFCTQTRGAAGLLACCAALWFEWKNRKISGRTLRVHLALLCGSTAVVWLSLSWRFIMQAGFSNYWQSQVVYLPRGADIAPGFLIPPFSWSPHPFAILMLLNRIVIYLILISTAPLTATLCLRRRFDSARNTTALFLLSCLGVFQLLEVATALNWNRMAGVAIPSTILAVFLLSCVKEPIRSYSFVACWIIFLSLVVVQIVSIHRQHYSLVDLPTGPALLQKEDAEEVNWLVHHTHPQDFFFEVAMTRLYAPLNLRNPTPVDVLTRNGSTLPVWVTEVIEGLEQSKARYVLWSERSGLGEVNRMHTVQNDHLDPFRSYLQSRYTPVKMFTNGDQIWERRSGLVEP